MASKGTGESVTNFIYCDSFDCGKEYEFSCRDCGGDFCQDHINSHYCGDK